MKKNDFLSRGLSVSKTLFLLSFVLFSILAPGISGARSRGDRTRWVRVPGGINTMRQLASTRQEMERVYAVETANYEAVYEAIEKGRLSPGMSGSEIEKRYGEALLKMENDHFGLDRWVYKPSEATYFSGPKIYVFIDPSGALHSWEIMDPSACSGL